MSVLNTLPVNCPIMLLGHNSPSQRISENLNFRRILCVVIIKQSDFHSNSFSGFRHTPSRKSPLLWVSLLRTELRPFIIIIPMSYSFLMHLIIHMFNTSVIHYISLDQYLTPNLYTIPNMQTMRFFCCSVYVCIYTQEPCVNPESFLKGGPTLTTFLSLCFTEGVKLWRIFFFFFS